MILDLALSRSNLLTALLKFRVYCMAWACQTVKKQNIVAMNQTMLLVNTLGSLVAPAVISLIMDRLGNVYLFVCFIFILVYFFSVLILSLMKNRWSPSRYA